MHLCDAQGVCQQIQELLDCSQSERTLVDHVHMHGKHMNQFLGHTLSPGGAPEADGMGRSDREGAAPASETALPPKSMLCVAAHMAACPMGASLQVLCGT